MTATRRAATIAVLSAGWIVAAALLWRTSVPDGLDLPALDAGSLFPAEQVERAERYERFLRWNALARMLAQLAVAVGVVILAPAIVRRLRGGPVVRGVTLVAIAYIALWLARLPFGLAALWWRRRYDVAREGYLDFVLRPWATLLGELLLACAAAAALMLLARRLGPRWWLAGAAAVAVLGTAYLLLQPLFLAPRFAPLPDGPVRRDIHVLAQRMGVDDVEVRLRKAAERTRAANAEVVGLGPSRRIVLWDTLLEGFSRGEIRAITAHELAHVSRRHAWKGIGWFLLAVVPALWLLDRAARLRGGLGRPEGLAAVIAAGLALQLAIAPAVSALAPLRSRGRLGGAPDDARPGGDAEPLPAGWPRPTWPIRSRPAGAYGTVRTHPSLLRGIAMAEACAQRERLSRGGRRTSRAGCGCPRWSATSTTSPPWRRAAPA